MPHRTRHRSLLGRVPLRVVILVIVALAALAATGCGDDDGLSILSPGRGLEGLWVRYLPPSGLPAALPQPPADTLLIADDLTALWSHEVEGSMGIEPLRIFEGVRIEQRGLGLLLFPLVAPCPNCRVGASERMVALAASAPFRLRRIDVDHFVLSATTDAQAGVRYYYERRPVSSPIME